MRGVIGRAGSVARPHKAGLAIFVPAAAAQ